MQFEQVNQWTPLKSNCYMFIYELFMLWLKTLIHLAARLVIHVAAVVKSIKKGGGTVLRQIRIFGEKRGALLSTYYDSLSS